MKVEAPDTRGLAVSKVRFVGASDPQSPESGAPASSDGGGDDGASVCSPASGADVLPASKFDGAPPVPRAPASASSLRGCESLSQAVQARTTPRTPKARTPRNGSGIAAA